MKRLWFWVMLAGLAGLADVRAKDSFLVSIRIPEPIESEDRLTKYEDPLHQELKALSLGAVTKAGTARDATTNEITYIWIDVTVSNIEKSIEPLKSVLRKAGAPDGTTLALDYGKNRRSEIPLYEKPKPRSFYEIGTFLFYAALAAALVAGGRYFFKKIFPSMPEDKTRFY